MKTSQDILTKFLRPSLSSRCKKYIRNEIKTSEAML